MQQADFLDNVAIRDLLVHANQQPSPSTKTFVLLLRPFSHVGFKFIVLCQSVLFFLID